MQQNINLYLLLPKPPKYQLTPLWMARIVGGFTGLLLLIVILHFAHAGIQKIQLSHWQKAYLKAVGDLSQLNAQHPGGAPMTQVQTQIKTLQTAIATDQALLDFIQQHINTSKNFTRSLLSLANNILPGVWLTQIKLTKSDTQVLLAGSAESANQITQFFQKIKKDPLFADENFVTFKINNSKNSAGNMDFMLSTQLIEKTPEPEQ